MVKTVDIQATLAELPVLQGRSTETPEEEVSEAFATLADFGDGQTTDPDNADRRRRQRSNIAFSGVRST